MNGTENDVKDGLKSALQEWSNKRQRAVVSIANTNTLIDERQVLELWGLLDDGGWNEPLDRIDLFIQSFGGDAHSAFQIIELIRRRMKDAKSGLTAIVPYRAASAATLMCLGCDTIMLGELGRLGPLDMQVYDDQKGGTYRFKSALNQETALEQLNEAALTLLRSAKGALVRDGALPHEAYELARGIVTGLFSPLYAQVSPEKLAENSRANTITLEYARCLLKRHSSLADAAREKLAKKLVKGYPSHGYYIDFEEAGELGLTVIRVEPELQPIMGRVFAQVNMTDPSVVILKPTSAPPAVSSAAAGAKKPGANIHRRGKGGIAVRASSNGRR